MQMQTELTNTDQYIEEKNFVPFPKKKHNNLDQKSGIRNWKKEKINSAVAQR